MSDMKYITIVDDHTMFRKGLTALINLFPNYKVLFDAANGQDFIKQLQPNIYCAVRCNGMGIAMGSLVGEEVAELALRDL